MQHFGQNLERLHHTRPGPVEVLIAVRQANAALEKEGEIDRVFLTGGSSFVPAVRRQFEARFGAEKIETGDQLVSIAYGLALIAQEEQVERWAA